MSRYKMASPNGQSEKISQTTSKTEQRVCDWKTERRHALYYCILGRVMQKVRFMLYWKKTCFTYEATDDADSLWNAQVESERPGGYSLLSFLNSVSFKVYDAKKGCFCVYSGQYGIYISPLVCSAIILLIVRDSIFSAGLLMKSIN